MRVAGYVRELPSAMSRDNAFMQSERIRRWAADGGHRLVAICQDGSGPDRPGLAAVAGIIASGQVDAVVVPSLGALASDKVTQEILLRRLRSLGVGIASADEADAGSLQEATTDPARRLIRTVLDRADDVRRHWLPEAATAEPSDATNGRPADGPSSSPVPQETDRPEVIVRLVPAGSQSRRVARSA